MTAERLSPRNTDVGYDRSAPPSIAHLGVGAFARAHLAVYADDLRRAGHPAMIRGVSLRSGSAEEQLGPQGGLFAIDEREPGRAPELSVVGSLASVGTGIDAAIEAIAAPTTALVTLTVTEKGYELDPLDGDERLGPRSAPAALAHGLDRRRGQGPPPVVASLDNVLDNGTLLRRRVIDAAEQCDTGLARWITEQVAFPSSVVDRMVPATTPADLDAIARRLGLRDEAAVVAEQHRSWFLTAADGLPPLAEVGVEVVGDIEPYQQRKLWLLNGPHSALAYAGLLAGCETIAEATAHPVVAPFVRRLVDDILEVADQSPGTEPTAFAEESLRRFANPELGHTCRQVGADGSRKLAQRLLPVAATRADRGLATARLAAVVALWLAAVTRLPLQGVVLAEVDDPDAESLRAAAEERDRQALVRAACGPRGDTGLRRRGPGHTGGLGATRPRRPPRGDMTIGGPESIGGNSPRNPGAISSNAVGDW